MANAGGGVRADRIVVEAFRHPAGRWIVGANACALGLYLASPWELAEVLVAFWLEAVAASVVFAVLIASLQPPGRRCSIAVRGSSSGSCWPGGFLALTGAGVSWTATQGAAADVSEASMPPLIPPVDALLTPAPWIAVGWVLFRLAPSVANALTGREPERRLGLAAAHLFVVYLPVLAVTAALFVLTGGEYQRLLPIAFLAALTYYELVLTLRLLPLLEQDEAASAA